MRIETCLDARCAAAMAVVVAPFDEEGAERLLVDVHEFAQTAGYRDFGNGVHEPPVLFQGHEFLESTWLGGNSLAAEHHEIQACTGCKNANGIPCPVHG